jgi:hypothetical protein
VQRTVNFSRFHNPSAEDTSKATFWIHVYKQIHYQLVFVAYNVKHAELRRKSKDWLLRNQDNVSEWSDMSSIWGRTKSHLRWCCEVVLPEVTWPEVTSVTWPEVTMSGSMFCACATGNCAISALVGPFDRKWRQSRDRKRPCPEVILTGSRFCHARLFPALSS